MSNSTKEKLDISLATPVLRSTEQRSADTETYLNRKPQMQHLKAQPVYYIYLMCYCCARISLEWSVTYMVHRTNIFGLASHSMIARNLTRS